jgi:hypothetical protein
MLRGTVRFRGRSRWERNTRLVCYCTGYWFPHRRGGGACDSSPRADYYRAVRDGVPHDEALQLLSADQLERMAPARA